MKKCTFVVKTIFQILIYLFELVGVSLAMTFFSHQYIEPILSCLEFVERMMLSYAIYQILVVVILTNINDIEKDSCLSYITVLKLCLVYKTTNNLNLKKDIISKIEFSTKPSVFNTPSIKNAFQKIKDNFENISQTEFELELINAEIYTRQQLLIGNILSFYDYPYLNKNNNVIKQKGDENLWKFKF